MAKLHFFSPHGLNGNIHRPRDTDDNAAAAAAYTRTTGDLLYQPVIIFAQRIIAITKNQRYCNNGAIKRKNAHN